MSITEDFVADIFDQNPNLGSKVKDLAATLVQVAISNAERNWNKAAAQTRIDFQTLSEQHIDVWTNNCEQRLLSQSLDLGKIFYKTEKDVLLSAIRISISKYRRNIDGDANDFYDQRYASLLKALNIPKRCVAKIDANLFHYLYTH